MQVAALLDDSGLPVLPAPGKSPTDDDATATNPFAGLLVAMLQAPPGQAALTVPADSQNGVAIEALSAVATTASSAPVQAAGGGGGDPALATVAIPLPSPPEAFEAPSAPDPGQTSPPALPTGKWSEAAPVEPSVGTNSEAAAPADLTIGAPQPSASAAQLSPATPRQAQPPGPEGLLQATTPQSLAMADATWVTASPRSAGVLSTSGLPSLPTTELLATATAPLQPATNTLQATNTLPNVSSVPDANALSSASALPVASTLPNAEPRLDTNAPSAASALPAASTLPNAEPRLDTKALSAASTLPATSTPPDADPLPDTIALSAASALPATDTPPPTSVTPRTAELLTTAPTPAATGQELSVPDAAVRSVQPPDAPNLPDATVTQTMDVASVPASLQARPLPVSTPATLIGLSPDTLLTVGFPDLTGQALAVSRPTIPALTRPTGSSAEAAGRLAASPDTVLASLDRLLQSFGAATPNEKDGVATLSQTRPTAISVALPTADRQAVAAPPVTLDPIPISATTLGPIAPEFRLDAAPLTGLNQPATFPQAALAVGNQLAVAPDSADLIPTAAAAQAAAVKLADGIAEALAAAAPAGASKPGRRATGAETAGSVAAPTALPLVTAHHPASGVDEFTDSRTTVSSAERPLGLVEPKTPQAPISRLRLELSPAHLGALTLEVRHDGQQVTALMVVDHDRARQVIQQAEGQVRQLLQDQGLQVGAFEVSCRDQGLNREQTPEQTGLNLSVSQPREEATDRPITRRAVATSALAAVDIYA